MPELRDAVWFERWIAALRVGDGRQQEEVLRERIERQLEDVPRLRIQRPKIVALPNDEEAHAWVERMEGMAPYIMASASSTTATLRFEDDRPKNHFTVYINGDPWATFTTEEEALQHIEKMKELNRWWVVNPPDAVIERTNLWITDTLRLGWQASLQSGQAGWNVKPITGNFRGEAVERYSDHEKTVRVTAPTSILAIERAKVLLLFARKERE